MNQDPSLLLYWKKMAKQHQHELINAPQNPTFLYDTLYCAEENFEGEVKDECFQEDEEEEGERYYNSNNIKQSRPFPILLECQDLFWEDEELSSLFAKEEQNQLYKKLVTSPSLALARQDAVHWVLKVHAHYSFTALTAVLAVNYLDRFLSSFHFQADKPWKTQLAAVACLSLAAKVEETQVPPLLDLQVEDSKYVFEPKTIQRMEILVLSTLQWRMNSITPLSFLDYITRRLGLKGYLCWEFLRRCERLVLSVISDSRSMHYVPSVMATAAMLHVMNSLEPRVEAEYESQLLGILGVNKDKVEECSKLIMEFASIGHGNQLNKRKFSWIPGSPKGVMDVSFSSDNSNDSWAVASSPEPLSKKNSAMQSLHHTDFLGIRR